MQRKNRMAVLTRQHNAYELTSEFIRQIDTCVGTTCNVFLVDDGSSDDSFTKLRDDYSQFVSILNSDKYVEYCKSLNIGIRHIAKLGYEFVFVVNNDTKNFSHNFISEALSQFDSDPCLAMLGPKVKNYDGQILSDGADKNKFGVNLNVPTEGYFLRISALQDIGLFDENLVRYFEDLDLVLRFRKKDWVVATRGEIWFEHLCNGSSSKQAWVPSFYRARNVQWFNKVYNPSSRWHWIIVGLVKSARFSARRSGLFLKQLSFFKAIGVWVAFLVGSIVGLATGWNRHPGKF